jgi:dTDP-4-amino-4,6-dideoxygalactose transaminase
LIAARSRRDSLVLARRQKYHVYIEQLAGAKHIVPIPLQDGAAPWRFNAVVDADRRDVVFHKLLASNVNASTWYPSMTEFLPEQAFRFTDLPVARCFGQTLLNLWVDETTDTQDIIRNCARLKQDLSIPGT